MKQPICLAAALLALFTMIVSPAVGQGLGISDTGIHFPDGTMLSSAWGRGLGYANVLVVAKSGGQFTSIQAALDAIGGTGPYGVPLPEATAENPYLIWVAPGVYEERVAMKEWVDIEGAGRGVTVIRHPAGEAGATTLGMASHSEVRSLTVENAYGGKGITAPWYGSIALTDVVVLLSEGGMGFEHWTIYPLTYPESEESARFAGPSELQDVTIRVTGGQDTTGILVAGSHVRLHDVYVEASGGTGTNTAIEAFDQAGLGVSGLFAKAEGTNAAALLWVGMPICPTPEDELRNATFVGDVLIDAQVDCPGVLIRDSTIDGDLIVADPRGDYVGVTNTILTGEAVGSLASFRCFSVFDRDLRPLDEHCQPVLDD